MIKAWHMHHTDFPSSWGHNSWNHFQYFWDDSPTPPTDSYATWLNNAETNSW